MAVPFPSDFGKSNGDGQGPQVCVRSEEMNPLYDFPLSCANASGSLLCRTTNLPTAEEGGIVPAAAGADLGLAVLSSPAALLLVLLLVLGVLLLVVPRVTMVVV